MSVPKLSPTQTRIMDILLDGKPHLLSELRECIEDKEAKRNTIRVHLTYLRKKLRPVGLNVLCVVHKRRFYYQLVRPINMD